MKPVSRDDGRARARSIEPLTITKGQSVNMLRCLQTGATETRKKNRQFSNSHQNGQSPADLLREMPILVLHYLEP